MLRALYERGVEPGVIVGTSAGRPHRAVLGPPPPRPPRPPQPPAPAEGLGGIGRGLRRGEVFPVNPITGLLGFLGARSHLVPDSGLRRLVEQHVECGRLESMPIPLHVVTVDVITGEEVR